MYELLNFIRRRTASVSCGIYIIALLVGYLLLPQNHITYVICSFSTLLLVFGAALLNKKIRLISADIPIRLTVFTAAIAIASVISLLHFGIKYENIMKYADGKVHTAEAKIVSVEYQTVYSTTYRICVRNIDGQKADFTADLTTEYPSDFKPRDIITFTGEFTRFPKRVSGFPQESYNRSKGIMLEAAVEDEAAAVGRETAGIRDIAVTLNKKLRDSIYYTIGDYDAAGFISGLFLGNKRDIPDTLVRDFRALGLSHMLALSGLHLGLLSTLLDRLLKKLGIGKRLRTIITLAAIPLYMLLTGMSPSIMRSGIMLMIALSARLLGTDYDSVDALFIAVTLICIASPDSVADIGLMMSFTATLGILTYGSALIKLFKKKRDILKIEPKEDKKVPDHVRFLHKIAELLCVSLSAILFVFPVTWFAFGEISVMGAISTLVASPVLMLVLTTVPFVFILHILPFGTLIAGRFYGALYYTISGVSSYFASPDMLVSLRYGFTKYIVLIFAVSLTVMFRMKKLNIKTSLIPLTSFIIIYALCMNISAAINDNITKAAYLTYKNNDMLIISSGGERLICDISDGSYRPSGEAEYAVGEEFMTASIDCYMLTHCHKRHISTFASLADRTFIKSVMLPISDDTDDIGVTSAVRSAAEQRGIEVRWYTPGVPFEFGGTEINVCPESKVGYSDHPVIALTVMTQDSTILYAGSSSFNSAAYDFIDTAANEAETVILGSHGPKQKFGIAADTYDNAAKLYYGSPEIELVCGFDSAETTEVFADNGAAYEVFTIE